MSKKTSSITLEQHTITLSNVDKVLYPKSGITKGQVIAYYQKIAPLFLAHARDRIMVMQRFPDGIAAEGFYQKQISDYFPAWIKRKKVALKDESTQTLVVPDSAAALVYLANQAVLVFHTWQSSRKMVSKPDRIVFDVDPSKNSLVEIRFAVRKIKKIVEEYGLTPFVMTTGSRSYHVVVPIIPEHSFATVKAFAKQLCAQLVSDYPDRFTIELNKSKRENKIFLDYLRNSFGQTSVACYSLRALEGAPVATPLDWREFSTTKPQQYTVNTIFKRLARKKDPWKDFVAHAQKLNRSSLSRKGGS